MEIDSDNSKDKNDIIQSHIRALPNSSHSSEQLTKTLGALMKSSNSSSIKSSPSGATIIGVPIYTMGNNTIRINDNVYELTPEIHKALASTRYDGRSMKDGSDFFNVN